MLTKKIYASSFAKLDSNVHTGGGTDDTAAIQALLDLAKDGNGLHLIMDGAALVTHLRLYSNTTIECVNKDCGFFQVAHTDDSILTNAVWDNYEVKTWNVSLIGGTYNQNCRYQAHDNPHPEGTFVASDANGAKHPWFNMALEFYGVGNMLIRDVQILENRTFALTVGCFYHLTVEDVWVDMKYHLGGNQDGLHFWGPGRFLTVRNCGGRTSDDFMNIGHDERDGISSITDVLVDGIALYDAEQGFHLLSRGTGRLDRVTIRNVTGQYHGYAFYINPFFAGANGNYGHIFIENIDLEERHKKEDGRRPVLLSAAGNIECLTLKNVRSHNGYDARTLFEFGLATFESKMSYKVDESIHQQKMQTIIIDGLTVTENEQDAMGREYITVYDHIENLVLKNMLILKDQPETNGKLIAFYEMGEIGNLLTESVYAKNLESFCAEPEKIRSRMQPM